MPIFMALNIFSAIYYATDIRMREHYKMMADVCLSVCRVPRPNSEA